MFNKNFLPVITFLFVGQAFDVSAMETDGQLVARKNGDDNPSAYNNPLYIEGVVSEIIGFTLNKPIILKESSEEVAGDSKVAAVMQVDDVKNFLEQMYAAGQLRLVSKMFCKVTDDYLQKKILAEGNPLCLFAKTRFFGGIVTRITDNSYDITGCLNEDCKRFGCENMADIVIKRNGYQSWIFKDGVMNNCESRVDAFNKYTAQLRLQKNENKMTSDEKDCIEAINSPVRDYTIGKYDEYMHCVVCRSAPLLYAAYNGWIPMVEALLEDPSINVNKVSRYTRDQFIPLVFGLNCLDERNYSSATHKPSSKNIKHILALITKHKNFRLTEEVVQELIKLANHEKEEIRISAIEQLIQILPKKKREVQEKNEQEAGSNIQILGSINRWLQSWFQSKPTENNDSFLNHISPSKEE